MKDNTRKDNDYHPDDNPQKKPNQDQHPENIPDDTSSPPPNPDVES
jgi:hypothetical protein